MYYVCLSMVCLQFTGDLSFAVGAVSMLMNECNDALIQNITLPASNSTTNSRSNSSQEVIIPAIVEETGQLLCPNDCAFNGKCVNGLCICNKDYTAEDCSISLYQVPDISRLVLCLCETEITQSMNLIKANLKKRCHARFLKFPPCFMEQYLLRTWKICCSSGEYECCVSLC